MMNMDWFSKSSYSPSYIQTHDVLYGAVILWCKRAKSKSLRVLLSGKKTALGKIPRDNSAGTRGGKLQTTSYSL